MGENPTASPQSPPSEPPKTIPLPEMPKEREKKQILEVVDKIAAVRLEKVLTMDKLVEDHNALIKLDSKIREDLLKASSALEVKKFKLVIESIGMEKVILQEKRHIIKLLEIEESKLRARLIELETSEA